MAARRDPLARAHHRPDPADWADDDQMTLAEYVAVFWPYGPVTVSSLRTEIARGRLTPARVRGLLWVTPASVKALFQPAEACPVRPKARASTFAAAASIPGPASPSLTSTTFETDRLKSAQAAVLIASQALKGQRPSSPPISARNGRFGSRKKKLQMIGGAEVIRLRS